MKRLPLALLLCCSGALAQTQIHVSVTYTPGAAQLASAAGTTVPAKVADLVNAANSVYAASGVQIALQANVVAAGSTAPPDSANMQAQFAWARGSVWSLLNKTGFDASIAIQVSAPSGGVSGVMTDGPINKSADAVAAIPYDRLVEQLEYVVSKMIGSTGGYSTRARSYATDPYLQGNNFCYHSRESAPSDPNAVVPTLAYWMTNGNAATQGPNAAASCEAFRLWLLQVNPQGGWYSSEVTGQIGTAAICNIKAQNGAILQQNSMGFTAATAGGPISCVDGVVNLYSSPNLTVPGNPPGWPLGDAAHDSVGAMNARASTVAAFQFQNGNLLKRARSASWWSIF